MLLKNHRLMHVIEWEGRGLGMALEGSTEAGGSEHLSSSVCVATNKLMTFIDLFNSLQRWGLTEMMPDVHPSSGIPSFGPFLS